MNDVFSGVPIVDSAGQTRDLAWLRRRWGPNLTGSWPNWKLVKVWESEGTMTCIVQILTEGGVGIPGQAVRWTWEKGGKEWRGATSAAGTSEWRIGDNEWVAAGLDGGPDHNKGAYDFYSDTIHLEGIGWAGGTNHSKANYVFQRIPSDVGPVITPPATPGPPPTPSPLPGGSIVLTQAEAQQLRAAASLIDLIIIAATNRQP